MTSMISSVDQTSVGDPDVVVLGSNPSIFKPCINNTVKRPNRIKPYPLSDVHDLKIQQGLIIKDLLFSSLGYEGCYIRHSEKYNASIEDIKVRGPDFKIAKHLDISLKSMTKQLIKFGKYYSGLKGFVEVYDDSRFGTILQKFCSNINEFLKLYRQVIIAIEQEFKYNPNFNLNLFETMINENANQIIHFYEIAIEIHELTLERQLSSASKTNQFQDFLTNVTSALEQPGIIDTNVNSEKFDSCKGGLVLRVIQSRINVYKGDIRSFGFLSSLFDSISEDYVEMLNSWLSNGEINDPSDEFLIREKPVPPKFFEIFNNQSEHYWNELFIIRTEGLIDQFTSVETQRKILNTGKYLNIFKNCTGLTSLANIDEISPIDKIFSKDLELKINAFHKRANNLLMKLLFEGYHVKNVVGDFQTLFLFNDSYKIDKFLDKSFRDLMRNRYSVSISKLQKQYQEVTAATPMSKVARNSDHTEPSSIIHEFVIHNQNFTITTANFYQVTKEIMNVASLDTNILQSEQNYHDMFENLNQKLEMPPSSQDANAFDQNHLDEYAVSSLDLSISLPFPLNLFINRELSYHYELMFKLQILIKFLGKLNDTTWKNINHSTVWKYTKFEPRIKKWILRCRVLHKRMIDFLNELQMYLNHDVNDTNYKTLDKFLEKVSKELKKPTTEPERTESQEFNGFSSRFGSSGPRSETGFNSALRNYNNNRSNQFDNKILSHEMKRSKNNFYDQEKSEKVDVSIEALMRNLNDYLNTLINDSLITREDLSDNLKNMFDLMVSYNNYLNRLKKVLILCNRELFERFASDYPDKFGEKSIDPDQIDIRFNNLNGTLKEYYESFGNSLSKFIFTLRRYGEIENKKILVLSERLEKSFPE